jgi:hypothetical protein
MSDLVHCLAVLKALGVSEIIYHLSGGGDEGTVELEQVIWLDGREAPLPAVTIGITGAGAVKLDECLESLVADLPDGDWVNNEGGYGNVILRPQETDEALRTECDMTYGCEEENEPDFADEEESADFHDHEAEPEPGPLAIDDTNLQPAKGGTP